MSQDYTPRAAGKHSKKVLPNYSEVEAERIRLYQERVAFLELRERVVRDREILWDIFVIVPPRRH